MNKILAILRKELASYFHSPMAYLVLMITLSIFNIFFFMIVDENQEASLRDIFKVMEFMFVFIVPLLTMKTFAEEKLTGTMEFLQTAPISNTAIVLGKYLGSLVFFTILLGLTSIYYILIEFFASPDRAATLTGYLGIWLEGSLFLAIGILTSSWTRNQILAAVNSYAVLFTLYFSVSLVKYFKGPLEGIARYVGTWSHMENLAAGLITSSDLIYYLSGIVLALCLTRLSIDLYSTRGRKGFLYRTVFVLALIILWAEINFLGSGYNLRFDLTRAKQHTLTQASKDILKDLKQDIQITALYSGIPPQYLKDLFKEYEQKSAGKISTQVIDPLQELSYAAQFGSVIQSGENKVIVQSGVERKDIDFTKNPLSEGDLTNAVLRVTRPPRHVYFLTGHGEYSIYEEKEQGLSILAKLLSSNNMIAQNLILGIEGKVPPDCDLLIVAGAQNFLTVQEENLIKDYLRQGGDAFFMVEHVLITTADKPLSEEELKKNPSLNNIVNDWGVNVAEDVVVDLISHAGDDVGCPATRNYIPFKAIIKDLDYTFYIRPRSISFVKDRRPSITAIPLVMTASGEQSWGETNRMLEVKFDEGVDRSGPVPIAFVVSEPVQGTKDQIRLAVFTDADFVSNAYISHYSNAQMAMNVISWLTDSGARVFIDSKEIKVERLDLTSQQKHHVVLILIALPFFIALLGLLRWLRSR